MLMGADITGYLMPNREVSLVFNLVSRFISFSDLDVGR
jgi:hypothetical protein